MKKVVLSVFVVSFCFFNSTFAQDSNSRSLPPISELPKVGEAPKIFHELDANYAFVMFDIKGDVIKKGTAKFIDITDLKAGTYFVKSNGKTEKVILE